MIRNVIEGTKIEGDTIQLGITEKGHEVMLLLRSFLYNNVYRSPQVHSEFEKARKILYELYGYFMRNQNAFLKERKRLFEEEIAGEADTPYERQVCDFIAGMSDSYAKDLFVSIFVPSPHV
jgi:dGTPase